VSTDAEVRIALGRATLVALYAMTGAPVDLAHAAPLWLPDLETLTVDEAIGRLAGLRSATRCVPFGTGRDIAIGAWDGRPSNAFREEVLDFMLRDIALRLPQYSPDDYEVTVRGEPDGDVARLTWPQYEQWTREFELVAPTLRMNVTISPADDHPPHFVVTISPPSAEGPVSGTYA
jgi:hypothetical protein